MLEKILGLMGIYYEEMDLGEVSPEEMKHLDDDEKRLLELTGERYPHTLAELEDVAIDTVHRHQIARTEEPYYEHVGILRESLFPKKTTLSFSEVSLETRLTTVDNKLKILHTLLPLKRYQLISRQKSKDLSTEEAGFIKRMDAKLSADILSLIWIRQVCASTQTHIDQIERFFSGPEKKG